MQALLSCVEADPNKQDERSETPIHLAMQKNTLPIVALLLKDGRVDVDLKDKFGRTALHLACVISSPETVSLIINWGNTSDYSESITPPLISASQVARDLREGLNAQDDSGSTPLHFAATAYSSLQRERMEQELLMSEECISHLLRHQATNPGIRDHKGQTVLLSTCLNKNCRLFDILVNDLKVRNSLGKKDFLGDTALSAAASVNEVHMIKRLLSLYEYDDKDLQKAFQRARGESRDFLRKKLNERGSLALTNRNECGRKKGMKGVC